jgi:hypothetical protein
MNAALISPKILRVLPPQEQINHEGPSGHADKSITTTRIERRKAKNQSLGLEISTGKKICICIRWVQIESTLKKNNFYA